MRYTELFNAEFAKRGEYKSNCPECAKEYTVLTQADHDPEYYTDITIVCDCGKYVYFNLPVN